MTFTALQWALGGAAGLLTGFSKTGMPGIGILVVPLLAQAFNGRQSVGTMLPMLLVGDLFAIVWYRKHVHWDKLLKLAPTVAVGMAVGTGLLIWLGQSNSVKDWMNPLIGSIVLLMLAIHVARSRWGDKLTPTSPIGTALVGTGAGFTTTVSNAAGQIMAIYLQAMGLPKRQFMGTTAWFFFLVNSVKVPLFLIQGRLVHGKPMMTRESLLFDLAVTPLIVVGVFLGRWFLGKVPQRAFDTLVLALAGVAAVVLIVRS